jgi:hypothetical protein
MDLPNPGSINPLVEKSLKNIAVSSISEQRAIARNNGA